MSWANVIEQLMREHRVGIADFARMVGIDPQSISNILSGRTKTMRVSAKIKIEQALGIRLIEQGGELRVMKGGIPVSLKSDTFEIEVTRGIAEGFDHHITSAKTITVQRITPDKLIDHGLYYIETEVGNWIRIYNDAQITNMGLFRAINPVESQILFSLDRIKIYRVVSINYDEEIGN